MASYFSCLVTLLAILSTSSNDYFYNTLPGIFFWHFLLNILVSPGISTTVGVNIQLPFAAFLCLAQQVFTLDKKVQKLTPSQSASTILSLVLVDAGLYLAQDFAPMETSLIVFLALFSIGLYHLRQKTVKAHTKSFEKLMIVESNDLFNNEYSRLECLGRFGIAHFLVLLTACFLVEELRTPAVVKIWNAAHEICVSSMILMPCIKGSAVATLKRMGNSKIMKNVDVIQ